MADYVLGGYNKGGRKGWRTVFIVIILLHVAGVGIYLYMSRNADEMPEEPAPEQALPETGLPPLAGLEPDPGLPALPVSTPESQEVVSNARAMIAGGQLLEARNALSALVQTTPDPEAVELLGEVNMKLLKSPVMMPGKEYYAIQSGDYLQKIARNFNTTVPLIKAMNGLKTDTIRAGARLLVFNGNFTIRVSKTRNTLDLLSNGKLFKRYPVGTGKFGKTPAIQFTIVDKIIEPPWTRPSDNRQIEYGDPDNVLGTRWMKITSKDHPEITGFGIHGTWERDSIGSQSSAGCIRMLNEDVEELFDLVPRGTKVVITD